jgi:hypothetical protein
MPHPVELYISGSIDDRDRRLLFIFLSLVKVGPTERPTVQRQERRREREREREREAGRALKIRRNP